MAKKISAAERKRIQRKVAMARARRAFLKRQAQEADEPEKKTDEEEPDLEAKKRQCARLRRRAKMLRKRAQEIENEIQDEEPVQEELDELEARKAQRRRAAIKAAAKRRAMRRKAQEKEIPEDIQPEPEKEEEEKEKEEEPKQEAEAMKARARRARALRRARRAMRKRSQDVSDDLKGPEAKPLDVPQGKDVSDDLAEPDEGDGGIQQTPAELPNSIDEAEEKVLAAYRLIEAQIARKVIPANTKKAELASKYAKKYTASEMKIAADNLSKAGSVVEKKDAAGVRVSKRNAMPYTKTAKNSGGMDDACLFF